MIDTMYITYQLSESEYKAMINSLNQFLKCNSLDLLTKKKKSDKNAKVTYGLASYGFEEIRLRNNQEYNYKAIEILLRPKLLVETGNYNDVTHPHEFEIVRRNFNYVLMDQIGLNVPDFFQWKVKRIDNAIDLKVDEKLIPKYMFLFKKGNLPDYMLNPNSLKYFQEKNNVYIVCKTFRINWYDRYLTQCSKQQKTKKQFNNIEQLKGTLRLEIQNRDVNDYIKPKNNLVLNFLDLELSQERIMYFYDLIVGSGHYYTYEQGVKIIEGVRSQTKRMALRRIYELINREGSVWKARVKYRDMKSDSTKAADEFSKRLNQLRKLGMNPVALPSQWGISSLPNLREDIINYFKSYLAKQKETRANAPLPLHYNKPKDY